MGILGRLRMQYRITISVALGLAVILGVFAYLAEFIVHSVTGTEHTEHESVMPEGHDEMGAQVSLRPLHVAAEGNQHADLVFEVTEPGEYEFYCSVPGHREAGMVGKIVIEE